MKKQRRKKLLRIAIETIKKERRKLAPSKSAGNSFIFSRIAQKKWDELTEAIQIIEEEMINEN